MSEPSWEVIYQARAVDSRRLLDSFQPLVQRAFPPLPPAVRLEGERQGCRELLRCIETGARPRAIASC